MACYCFNSFQRPSGEGLGIDRAKKTANVDLRRAEHGARLTWQIGQGVKRWPYSLAKLLQAASMRSRWRPISDGRLQEKNSLIACIVGQRLGHAKRVYWCGAGDRAQRRASGVFLVLHQPRQAIGHRLGFVDAAHQWPVGHHARVGCNSLPVVAVPVGVGPGCMGFADSGAENNFSL